MTLRQIQDDLLQLLTRSTPGIETRIEKRHLRYKVNEKRAKTIKENYMRHREVQPVWLQRLGELKFTRVTSSDDPNLLSCDCTFGKATIPAVVSLPDDLGVYRVASSCNTKKYYPIKPDRFFAFDNGSVRSKSKYFFRIGNSLYVSPYIKEGNVTLILEDPLTGWNLKTETVQSGSILEGVTYVVESGTVTYNSVLYQKASTFVGVAGVATYTGTGVVKHNDKKVAMTIDDDYPMSHTMTEQVVMQILTNDYKIESQTISEQAPDGQDDTIVKINEQ